MDSFLLTYDFGVINVIFVRKNIKNVHLKVFRDCTATLSMPLSATDDWAKEFVLSKKDWIQKQLDKYIKTSGYNNLVGIKNGASTQMLGKDTRLLVKMSKKNYVEKDEKNIIIYCNDIHNNDKIDTIFQEWWREQAYLIYNSLIDKLMPIFKPYGINKPNLYIKKMKTMWGSCSVKFNKVTFNEYLLKADLYCIEYVVLHELTHLIHFSHNQDFYDFLTIHMPDWQKRKKILDNEVVQGL